MSLCIENKTGVGKQGSLSLSLTLSLSPPLSLSLSLSVHRKADMEWVSRGLSFSIGLTLCIVKETGGG